MLSWFGGLEKLDVVFAFKYDLNFNKDDCQRDLRGWFEDEKAWMRFCDSQN